MWAQVTGLGRGVVGFNLASKVQGPRKLKEAILGVCGRGRITRTYDIVGSRAAGGESILLDVHSEYYIVPGRPRILFHYFGPNFPSFPTGGLRFMPPPPPPHRA